MQNIKAMLDRLSKAKEKMESMCEDVITQIDEVSLSKLEEIQELIEKYTKLTEIEKNELAVKNSGLGMLERFQLQSASFLAECAYRIGSNVCRNPTAQQQRTCIPTGSDLHQDFQYVKNLRFELGFDKITEAGFQFECDSRHRRARRPDRHARRKGLDPREPVTPWSTEQLPSYHQSDVQYSAQ